MNKTSSLQEKLFEIFHKYPHHAAIEWGEEAITYSYLEKKSALISNLIIQKGIKPGSFIGICIENRIDFIYVLIGILKARCVFLPLDTIHPENRIRHMLRTTNTSILFTDTHQYDRLFSPGNTDTGKMIETLIKIDSPGLNKEDKGPGDNHHPAPALNIVDLSLRRPGGSFEKPPPGPLQNFLLETPALAYHPEDPLYIYFTSGSTGEPKGILGKNKSLLHFINWELETFAIDETTRVSQLINTGFDAFLRDLFVPLFSGGTLCVPYSPEEKRILTGVDEISRWIEKKGIHLVHYVPTLFRELSRHMCNSKNLHFRELKYVLLSGEKIKAHELKNWYDRFNDRIQLVNLYGPTETTLIKTYYFINKSDIKNEKRNIPIGKPMKGARIILFDKNMNVCDRGVIGEIYIRTPYGTFGYYNDPGLNKQRFIPNPMTNSSSDLLYKTGDLGKELPDGNFEFLGRIDRQVKIRGVRIEPGEIENLLLGYQGVEEVVVIPLETPGGDHLLYAFYVSKNKVPESRIREFLFSQLPDYMVPTYIFRLDSIPLLPNGKMDREELNALSRRMASKVQYIAPRNAIEQKLADLWSQVLKKDKIGIQDNFFQLGGQSLKMLILASEIKKNLDVELTMAQLFNHPRIDEMAQYISLKQRGAIFKKYRDEPLVIFNKTNSRELFCFPPQMGYGIAYKELSDLLPQYAVYSFHFIEEPDRIRQYADLVEKVRESDSYCFFGYSAGGNLAFTIAREMERRGKRVSDVIIMDSFRRPVTCKLGTEEELNRFLENLGERMERMGLGFLKESAIAKARNYTHWLENSIDRGLVGANLHLITSTDRQQRESQLKISGPWQQGIPVSTGWEQHTSGNYFVYPGAGKHIQMLEPGFLEKNAGIIDKILCEAKNTPSPDYYEHKKPDTGDNQDKSFGLTKNINGAGGTVKQ